MNEKHIKGQVAIYIIIAIVLIAMIAAFFLLRGANISSPFVLGKETSPEGFISERVKSTTEKTINILIPQGGFLKPTNYKMYNDFKVSYLCENIGNFKPCINQHPMFLTEISNEILENITPVVERSFRDMKTEFEKIGYSITIGSEMSINVSLSEDRVYVDILREVTISKSGETRKFSSIRVEITIPLYNLAKIASDISNNEAKFCYFESVGYTILYPRYSITQNYMSDSTKIYSITDRNSGKEMNIAIRGCVTPSGL